MKLLAFSFVCIFSFSACTEDSKEVSDVAIFIEPGAASEVVANSGDKILYHIDMYTTHDYVSRLRVASFDSFNGEVAVRDTLWDGPCKSYDFVYTVPAADRDSLDITLTFNAWDNVGNKCEAKRRIVVLGKSILIGEKSGIVLWPAATGRPDALAFEEPSQPFAWKESPDSVRADMYIDSDVLLNNVALRSRTSAKFVRNNSFDYAAATSVSIQAVYAGSRRDDMIDDLRVNDIILVGHDGRAEGVFRVTNILRGANEESNCVQLAFKGVG